MSAMNSRTLYLAAAASALLCTGCQTANHTQTGALVGTGLGALTGAVVGAESGHSEGGAVIGALAGAALGSAVGAAEDAREERDAIAQAHFNAQVRDSVTNGDLVMMTRNGLSDEVIVSTIRAKGGRFDLSPQSVIALKNNGVSDAVIVAAQENNHNVAVPEKVTVVHEHVYDDPDVHFGVMFGPQPRYCHPRHRVHWGYHHHW